MSHRVSSAYYPRANKQSEVAVKSAKWLVMENLEPKGQLGTDRFARALLLHRNIPDQLTGLSPAMILFGRELRDHLHAVHSKYQPGKEWRIEADLREQAFSPFQYITRTPSPIPSQNLFCQVQDLLNWLCQSLHPPPYQCHPTPPHCWSHPLPSWPYPLQPMTYQGHFSTLINQRYSSTLPHQMYFSTPTLLHLATSAEITHSSHPQAAPGQDVITLLKQREASGHAFALLQNYHNLD